MGGVEYQVTKVDPTNPETKGMVYQVHKVTEEVAATLGGKVYRARIIKDPTEPTVAGKVYQIVLIGDPDDPAVKGKVYNAILTGGSEVVVVGPAVSPLALDDAIADTLTYVKAYGGTEQGLPDGYTQLEYIVFDATQVIDTGFTPDNNSRIESKCYRTGADCWFYGASPANPRVTLYHSSAGTCRWGNQSRSNVGFVADTEYTIIEDKNGININGIDNPWISGTAGDFTCDRSLTIGNNNGSTGTRYFAGNFYYMKIYNNGVLVRDFVPCKNASNVVGLYDKVNGVFYTDTGLAAGPDTVPSPDVPMDIISNNGALKARHQSGLPLGYTLLDYIESSGTQYIDLGIKGNGTTKVDVKFKYHTATSASGSGRVFGSRNAAAVDAFAIGSASGTTSTNSTIAFFFGNQSYLVTDKSLVLDEWLSVIFDKTTHSINGTDYGDPYNDETFETPQNLKLFGFDNNSSVGVGYVDIAYCKLWNNGVLVRDLIPAKNNSNIIGMYDLVSGQFFTNQGTDDFIAGTAVSDSVEIYTDGTVETIEDSLNNTATAEMLLKVGDYTDSQDVISGEVTRKVGIKVLDGTENWTVYDSSIPGLVYSDTAITNNLINAPVTSMICSHLQIDKTTIVIVGGIRFQGNVTTNKVTSGRIYIKANDTWSLAQTTQWLAEQYAAGTPVTIIYPLAQAVTEQVAPQVLNVQTGDNILEITQASLSNLELEAKYKKSA